MYILHGSQHVGRATSVFIELNGGEFANVLSEYVCVWCVHMYVFSGLCFQGAILSFPLSWNEITAQGPMTSLFPLWAKNDVPRSVLFKVCFEETVGEVDGSWEKMRNKLQPLPFCPGAASLLGRKCCS